ncbi:MAG: nucleotidyltransferase family protein [Thalassobaculum sp.]|uniref:nucleotidyltransferase family protein n=1 Tax=Thalassobaculum sp. TaxID=2022740 RepID=UPI0032EED5D4
MTRPDDGRFTGWWRRALGLDEPPGTTISAALASEAVALLSPVLGPLLARWPVAGLVPPAPSEAAEAAYRRLLLARQAEILAELRAAGLPVLAIKGFDAARLYDPPSVRILGDLDLLVPPRQAGAVVQELKRRGFALETSPQGALGVTSDVSFHPMVSPDGLVSVDLHTALDAYPLSAVLGAETVFAQATAGDGGRIAPHHAALAALSNAAKERFAPYAWRHLLDLGRLALRESVDWPAVDRVAVAAGLGPAHATLFGALHRLGVPPQRLPAHPDPEFGPARRLARDLGQLRTAAPGRLAKTVREAGWCYAPATVARLWRFRLAGLLRPRSGRPPGLD